MMPGCAVWRLAKKCRKLSGGLVRHASKRDIPLRIVMGNLVPMHTSGSLWEFDPGRGSLITGETRGVPVCLPKWTWLPVDLMRAGG